MPTDDYVLTVRLFDPIEKQNSKLAASWGTIRVPRSDVSLPEDQFIAKYVKPCIDQIENHKLTPPVVPSTLMGKIAKVLGKDSTQ